MNAQLWRNVAAQARLGTPVPDALDRLALRDPQAARLARRLREGATLTESVKRERPSPLVLAGVRVAESSGDLARGLEELADLLDATDERRGAWRTAMAYPQVLAFALAALAATCGPLVRGAQAPLDAALGTVQRSWMHEVVHFVWSPTSGAVLGGLALMALLVMGGRFGLEPLQLRLPYLGEWRVRLEMVTWMRWLDWLAGRGVPLSEAARTAAGACSSPTVRRALERTASRVEQGAPLQQALAAEPLVPEFARWLVGHAERVELREHMLGRAAAILEREDRATEQGFYPMLEQLAVLLIGGGVAIVVATFFLEFMSICGGVM